MDKKFLILGAILIGLQPLASADIFDKADCIMKNDCEKAGKWTKRLAAFGKCQAEGNCTEKATAKINETVANNQDKIADKLLPFYSKTV